MIYRYMVGRSVRQSFLDVNNGAYEKVVRQFAPHAVHWFSGTHTLSGKRNTPEDIQDWYTRLQTLLPDLKFHINALAVKGWPWHTTVFVEWTDFLTDRQGKQYSNQGVHVITLAWGKITELRIYCDTQLLASVCQTLGEQGVSEATAAPIESVDSQASRP